MTGIRLRRARKDDADLLFSWRNDHGTRHQSRHTGPTGWEEHAEWFARAMRGVKKIVAHIKKGHAQSEEASNGADDPRPMVEWR